jgi:AcrR family transcriptional regulator
MTDEKHMLTPTEARVPALPLRRGPKLNPVRVLALLELGALRLFRASDYPITVEKLVEAAGTNKPRVYRHFRDGVEVRGRTFVSLLNHSFGGVIQTLGERGPVGSRVDALASLPSVAQDLPLYGRVVVEAHRLALTDRNIADDLAALDEAFQCACRELFARGIKQAAYATEPDVGRAAGHAVRVWRGAMVRSALRDNGEAVPEETARLLETLRSPMAG